MRKRDLVDGLVGPRVREMMDQMLCMKGMTNAEKVNFLMSRNRELRAENDKLHVELTDLRLKSCPSCGIKVENEELRKERDVYRDLVGMMDHPDINVWLQAENDKLRELVRCLVNAEHPSDRATLIANAADMLAELGVEVNE